MLLAGLQRQNVWACRSRIHIMNTANPPYTPCVYLGKCGLLGGRPTQQVPSPGEGGGIKGPFMTLDSDDTRTVSTEDAPPVTANVPPTLVEDVKLPARPTPPIQPASTPGPVIDLEKALSLLLPIFSRKTGY